MRSPRHPEQSFLKTEISLRGNRHVPESFLYTRPSQRSLRICQEIRCLPEDIHLPPEYLERGFLRRGNHVLVSHRSESSGCVCGRRSLRRTHQRTPLEGG